MATQGTSLSPDELDRLEDALERWTEEDFEPGPEDSLLAAPLRERLDGYREVLTHTRAALPLEDVGDDVLAAVLAEARRTESKTRREATGPGLWERLRRSMLLPGVALTGSAALLLYLVQPSEELTLDSPGSDEAPAAREEARLAPEPGPAPAGAIDAADPEGVADVVAPAPVEAKSSAAEIVAPGADSTSEKLDGGAKAERAVSKKPSRKVEAPMDAPLPGLDDAEPTAGDKEELRDLLEKADAARHRGDCGKAMNLYVAAMQLAGPVSERAQARAGQGICLQLQGDEAGAEKYFEKARKMWSGVDAWLAREGVDRKASKSKPAAPSKPKKAVAEPFR